VIDNGFVDILRSHPATRTLRAADVVALTAKGVNHDHYAIRGAGLVLRVPRATPWAGDAAAQIESEAAAFARAGPSGATPRLEAVLPPTTALPRGALLVEEIVGRVPRLPEDLPALAEALARLHSLPLPPPEERPPLPDHGILGPLAATLAVIARQREFLPQIELAPATRAGLDEEYAYARQGAADASRGAQPLALVGTDTHPGNFIIRVDGSAVLVDLERVCYGSPAIDLAHATLYTSTTWDLEVQAVLTSDEVSGFYRHYHATVGPTAAGLLRPWLMASRRLTWLRTMMWAVRLQVLDARNELDFEPRLARHIRARLEDFFNPAIVARVRAEWLDAPLFKS
jgi:Phosphotransferase enzyme family